MGLRAWRVWCVPAIGLLLACYEHAPRRGPLARIADSLQPRTLRVEQCRDFPADLDSPHVRGCLVGTTAVMVDRMGRVQHIVRHERTTRDSAAQVYGRELATLQAAYGPGVAVCYEEDGRPPEGRFWQLPAFHVHLTPARDSLDIELAYALGRPKYGAKCRVR